MSYPLTVLSQSFACLCGTHLFSICTFCSFSIVFHRFPLRVMFVSRFALFQPGILPLMHAHARRASGWYSPLTAAIQYECLSGVEFLLGQRASPGKSDGRGLSPMYMACLGRAAHANPAHGGANLILFSCASACFVW